MDHGNIVRHSEAPHELRVVGDVRDPGVDRERKPERDHRPDRPERTTGQRPDDEDDRDGETRCQRMDPESSQTDDPDSLGVAGRDVVRAEEGLGDPPPRRPEPPEQVRREHEPDEADRQREQRLLERVDSPGAGARLRPAVVERQPDQIQRAADQPDEQNRERPAGDDAQQEVALLPPERRVGDDHLAAAPEPSTTGEQNRCLPTSAAIRSRARADSQAASPPTTARSAITAAMTAGVIRRTAVMVQPTMSNVPPTMLSGSAAVRKSSDR